MEAKLKGAVDTLYEQLAALQEQERSLKITINGLYIAAQEPVPFPDANSPGTSQSRNILPDQFFGKGLVPAVRDYLKMKGRAATVREIFDSLKSGGYEFVGDEKLQYRNFTIALSKRKESFVYVKPTDSWGLPEFYPGYVPKKEKNAPAATNGAATETAENTEDTNDEKEPLTNEEAESETSDEDEDIF